MDNKMELTEFEFPDEVGTKNPPEEKVNKAAARRPMMLLAITIG